MSNNNKALEFIKAFAGMIGEACSVKLPTKAFEALSEQAREECERAGLVVIADTSGPTHITLPDPSNWPGDIHVIKTNPEAGPVTISCRKLTFPPYLTIEEDTDAE